MNTSDVIITLLGDSGKKEWLRTDVMNILSEKLRIEKNDANSRFSGVFSRGDFFDKIGDNPVRYRFSKTGELRYATLNKQKIAETTFRTDINEFLKLYYWEKLLDCALEHTEYLEVDYQDLVKGLPSVAEGLREGTPVEQLKNLNFALSKIDLPVDSDFRPDISIYNFDSVLAVEDVKTKHISKFIGVEGRVVFQGMPKSELVNGAFKCQRCGDVTFWPQAEGKFVEPFECQSDACGRKGPFKLLESPDSEYRDAQDITIESLRGQVTIKVHLTGSLCQPPWERDAKVVRVCGIVNTVEMISRTGSRSNSYNRVIEANSIRFADDSNTEPPTEDEIKLFDEWAKSPQDLRKKLLSSIAPNVYGQLNVKDACCLAIFSDWNWKYDPRDVIERSSINVLLFGDPGVAKSQIVKDVVFNSPKGKFGQVTNMTKGGLSTVAVQENGEWCVKSGFFSQADQGVAGLDEIDKVQNPQDLNCLVSVMNDQIQLVSKIGKNDIPFNTRCALLGAANPKGGGYLRKDEDVMQQIEATIPSYIFQRFDLIYAMRDIPDKEMDTIIADSVNSMHADPQTNRKNIPREIPPELFRKYVLYARSKPVPEFDPGAQKLIKEYYLQLRTVPSEYPVIGARQVNNINRLARAAARREMALTITEDHVRYAIGLMRASMSTLTDEVDFGVYNSSRTMSQTERIHKIKKTIVDICVKAKCAQIKDIAFTSGFDEVEVEHTLMLMERNKDVYRFQGGYRVP